MSATGRLVLYIFAALGQLEVELLRQRTRSDLAASARTVESVFAARRLVIAAAGACRTRGQLPPIFRAAKPCPARAGWPIRTALATEMPKRSAATRTVDPSVRAAATRLRKSRESGRTMPAGLLPAAILNHVCTASWNPGSDAKQD